MPGFDVADTVPRRLRRLNFVGPAQPTRMQETEAFREGERVKESRIRIVSNRLPEHRHYFSLFENNRLC